MASNDADRLWPASSEHRGHTSMMKLSVGDLVFMAFGVGAIVVMMLLGPGQEDGRDPAAEQRSREAFLRQIERPRSPVLTAAVVVAISAATYAAAAIIAKAT